MINEFKASNKEKVFRTRESKQNGLFPIWYDTGLKKSEITAIFEVSNVECSFVRFSVIELDLIRSDTLLAQATFPVSLLRQGKI